MCKDLQTKLLFVQLCHLVNNSELVETTYSAKRGHTNCLLKFYNRYPQLRTVYEASNTVLLYPGPDAQDIQDVVRENGPGKYNIILLDGTWAQARGIFLQNLCLQKLKKVMIVLGEGKAEAKKLPS